MLLLFLYLTFMAPEVILVCPRAREGTDDTRAGGAAVASTGTRPRTDTSADPCIVLARNRLCDLK